MMKAPRYLAPLLAAPLAIPCQARDGDDGTKRPNILFCVVDDVSYGHWGCYGCDWIKTPGCDFVARSGVRFTNAYTPNAKSGPSRSCILTGLTTWQLRDACNHFAFFPADIRTFPEVLSDEGYTVGMTGKGWFPGDPGKNADGTPRELAGKKYNGIKCTPPYPTMNAIDYSANFRNFLKRRDPEAPFFFWYGGWEAHRPYTYGSGEESGLKPGDVDGIPLIFPDCGTVRKDLTDYGLEMEYFDSHLQKMIAELRRQGLLENTIIIVTSDNGMSFPRIKGQCYYDSHHLPLVMMWQGHFPAGSTVESPVSFTDFAPTILEAAGIAPSKLGTLEGRSIMPVLKGDSTAATRSYVCMGKERHDVGRPGDAGYPIRAIVSGSYMYIHNYETAREPAGNPQTGYLNYDGSPTKTLLLGYERAGRIEGMGRRQARRLFKLSFGKRPSEELYDIARDPDCMHNLAGRRPYRALRDSLRCVMEEQLRRDGDPRMYGHGDDFDRYVFSDPRYRGFYDRMMSGEKLPPPNWITPSDIDTVARRKVLSGK